MGIYLYPGSKSNYQVSKLAGQNGTVDLYFTAPIITIKFFADHDLREGPMTKGTVSYVP